MNVALKTLVIITGVLLVAVLSDAGTACPPRRDVFPCHCTSVEKSAKQLFTIVTCRHVPNTKSLASVFSTFRNMQIDRFILYDSFWEAENFGGKETERQRQLPTNWLSLLHIRELEIVDSMLSKDFACDVSFGCPNAAPQSLLIYNSSKTDSVTTVCQNDIAWLACLSGLREFRFIENNLKSLDSNFFPLAMNELATVNFTKNDIASIEKGTFSKLKKLAALDLSRNKITDITRDIFGTEMTLTYLDLSDNFIKKLHPTIFKSTPALKTFVTRNNFIEKMPYDDWKQLSKSIMTIDMTGNPLKCDCHMIWVNCTTKSHVNIFGMCSNPGFDKTPLRRVSRYMSERCDGDKIVTRDKDNRRNRCAELLKEIGNGTIGQVSQVITDQDQAQSRRGRSNEGGTLDVAPDRKARKG